jgi:hypothetical protein
MPVATALLCLLMLFQRTATRPLRELGTIELPKRLEPRAGADYAYDAVFVFEHVYDSIFLIGSNTPISEKLVLVFTGPHADPAETLRQAQSAADRTHVASWRNDGPYLIGEGIHEVNTAKHPAWVIVRKDDAHHVTAGYMRWQKQGSLADSKATLDRALSSLRLKMAIPDYLRLAGDRPALLAKQNQDRLRQILATKDVPLTLNGPVHESGGIFYSFVSDSRLGPRFDALALLGDRPAGRYRIMNPTPPRGIDNLPNICSVQWTSDGWAPTPNCSYLLPRPVADTFRKRLTDRTRVYFFATASAFPSDPEIGSRLDIEVLWKALPFLKERFDQIAVLEPHP